LGLVGNGRTRLRGGGEESWARARGGGGRTAPARRRPTPSTQTRPAADVVSRCGAEGLCSSRLALLTLPERPPAQGRLYVGAPSRQRGGGAVPPLFSPPQRGRPRALLPAPRWHPSHRQHLAHLPPACTCTQGRGGCTRPTSIRTHRLVL